MTLIKRKLCLTSKRISMQHTLPLDRTQNFNFQRRRCICCLSRTLCEKDHRIYEEKMVEHENLEWKGLSKNMTLISEDFYWQNLKNSPGFNGRVWFRNLPLNNKKLLHSTSTLFKKKTLMRQTSLEEYNNGWTWKLNMKRFFEDNLDLTKTLT